MSDQHEIVLNVCYGGFGLSQEAQDAYRHRTGTDFDECEGPRDDPALVAVVKELGTRADGLFAKLKIVHIPAQYARFYSIREYDGHESVRILYDAYKICSAKRMLRDACLTQRDKITRALAVLDAELE